MPKQIKIAGVTVKRAENIICREWGSIIGKQEALVRRTLSLGDSDIDEGLLKTLIKAFLEVRNRLHHLRVIVKQEWEIEFTEPYPEFDEEEKFERGWDFLKKMYEEAADKYERGEKGIALPTISSIQTEAEVSELAIEVLPPGEEKSDDEDRVSFVSTRQALPAASTSQDPENEASPIPHRFVTANPKTKSIKQLTIITRTGARPQIKYDPSRARDIAEFSGDIIQYQTFRIMFDEYVDETDASNVTKLNVLHQKLKGQPLELVKSFMPSQINQALKALDKEYSQDISVRMQVSNMVSKLSFLKHRDDLDMFKTLIGKIRAISGVLDALKADASFENDICSKICIKFPSYLIDPFVRNSVLGYYKVHQLVEHLEREIEIPMSKRLAGIEISRPTPSTSNANKQIPKREGRRKFNQGRAVNSVQAQGKPKAQRKKTEQKPKVVNQAEIPPKEQTNELPCTACKGPSHNAVFCHRTPFHLRLQLIEKYNLCKICLEAGHPVEKCNQGNILCPFCNGPHSKIICDKRYGTWKPKQNNNQNRQPRQAFAVNDTRAFEDTLASLFDDDQGEAMIVESDERKERTISIPILLDGRRFKGLVDTGANVNIIPQRLAGNLRVESSEYPQILQTPNGPCMTERAVEVMLRIGNIEKPIRFLLSDTCEKIILGIGIFTQFFLELNWKKELKQFDESRNDTVSLDQLMKEVMTVESYNKTHLDNAQIKALKTLLRKFNSIFAEGKNEVGEIKTEECKIIVHNELPINIRPYRCSTKDQDIIDGKMKELKQCGIVEDSTSPYSFPIVLVGKKDEGEKSRLCINYQKLNEITLTEIFPMPIIETIQDKLVDARLFTTLDINSAFYHVKVRAEDRHKLAFSSNNGHYQWNRMPFGIKNAPIIFQRVITNLLIKYELNRYCTNYIDDIIVFSKMFEEHLEHLNNVFKMLLTEDIRIKLSKCHFAKQSVKYLGHLITPNHIGPLQSNTEAIELLTPPHDLTSLRSFLGKVHYYKRFIENRTKLMHPLYQLLKKNIKWEWNDDCQTSFDQVKNILTSSPVLRIFHPNKPIFLCTDCSKIGMGAILKQCEIGETKPRYVIGYFSRPLQKYQMNYSATELELLAIIESIKFWHFYLVGRKFTILTDHLPLKAVKRFDKPNTRLFNWAMLLNQYDFEVQYQPGVKNQEADYLSRHPVHQLKDLVKTQALWVDAKDIIEAQKDLNIKQTNKIIDKISNGIRTVIYKKGDIEKSVLPDNLTNKVIHELHLRKGHLGPKQMETQFIRKYYNPNLPKIIKQLVMNCGICQQVRNSGVSYGTLGLIGPAEHPYHIVHIDTKSGFKSRYGSAKDNLHIAIDAFTRFVWIVSSRTKIAKDFINLINQIKAVQSPTYIVADNYPAIKSKEFKNYLHQLGIKILFTSANHPSSNGIVERVNQTLLGRLTAKRLENPAVSWTTLITKCVNEYNDSIHTVTEYTPKYLLTGLDPENLFQNETLDESRKYALTNSTEGHRRSAKHYNRAKRDPDIQVGDKVMVDTKHKLHRHLLEPKYEGPYEVTKKIGHTSYGIDKRGRDERYHVSKLKPIVETTTKARPKLPTEITSLFVALSLLICVNAQTKYAETGPFVLQKTNYLPTVGFNYSTHVAVFANLCEPLARVSRLYNITDTSYRTCVDEYDKMFSGIRKWCPNIEQITATNMLRPQLQLTQLNRGKRQVIVAGAVATIVSFGVMTVRNIWDELISGNDVQAVQTELVEKLNKVRKHNKDTEQIQRHVLVAVRQQWKKLQDLEFLVEQHHTDERVLELLLNKIQETKSLMQHLLRGFSSKPPYVTIDYDILFPENPWAKLLDSTAWRPRGCNTNGNNTLVLKFEIPIVTPEWEILKIDAFQVVDKIKTYPSKYCLMKYTGHDLIMMHKVTQCTHDLLVSPPSVGRSILVHTHYQECVVHQNRTLNWKQEICAESIAKLDALQTKRDDEEMYVYCYEHQLQLPGHDQFKCANTVYRFPINTSYAVDQEPFSIHSDVYVTQETVPSTVTLLVNQRTFYPQVEADTKIFQDLSELINDEENINKDIEWDKVATHHFAIIFYTIMTILFIIIVYCVCNRRTRTNLVHRIGRARRSFTMPNRTARTRERTDQTTFDPSSESVRMETRPPSV